MKSSRWYVTPLLAVVSVLGCEQAFQPIQPSDDVLFSIYGYLDASADTQWIRVMPIREGVETSTASLEASVRLEHAETGRAIPLSDSLFAFPAEYVDDSLDRYARIFWTTETIEPGATYQFTVTRSDGASSSVTARVPEDVEEIVVQISQAPMLATTPSSNGVLRLPTSERLAMVHVIPSGSRMVNVNHRWTDSPYPPCPAIGGPPMVYQSLPGMNSTDVSERVVNIARQMFPSPSNEIACDSPFRFRWWDISVVLTGSPWPHDPGWSDPEALLPDAGSNVTNGTGFLGGIITRTVPFETCYVIGLSRSSEYCELAYSDRSATIEGILTCPDDGVPVPNASVFLWEDEHPDVLQATTIRDYIGAASITLRKPDGVKVRTAFTDSRGSFRIRGLEAGVPYALAVAVPAPPISSGIRYPNFRYPNGYEPYENPTVLEEGQVLSLDIEVVEGVIETGCP
jgi:hypothetical protein